jgi:hypothetical protein
MMSYYIGESTARYVPEISRRLMRPLFEFMAHEFAGPMAAWEDEARRNSHNPYGARLAAILPGLRALFFGDSGPRAEGRR